MSDNNKSGYQIRAEMLSAAACVLSDRIARQEQNEHFLAENSEDYQRKAIEPYTTEEVIAEAEKLYAFVQNK